MTRRLIVNADDFGLTIGVSRGIARAHADGIVTATSLMVDEPAAQAAVELAADLPRLDGGLHAVAPADGDWPRALQRQLDRFTALTGRAPTHLDSHHHAHLAPAALPHFLRAADELCVPLRGHSPASLLRRFYGRWDDETHPEWLAAGNLLRLVDEHGPAAWIELMCHPGHADGDLRSSYSAERDLELATLCDPHLPAALAARGIELAGFRDLTPAMA
jgi:chitin disaccharide deacetylase